MDAPTIACEETRTPPNLPYFAMVLWFCTPNTPCILYLPTFCIPSGSNADIDHMYCLGMVGLLAIRR